MPPGPEQPPSKFRRAALFVEKGYGEEKPK
jgi:hypothetical protein